MILNETVAAIADAIREKTGKSELIAPIDFAEEIKGISAGGGDAPSGDDGWEYYKFDGVTYENTLKDMGYSDKEIKEAMFEIFPFFIYCHGVVSNRIRPTAEVNLQYFLLSIEESKPSYVNGFKQMISLDAIKGSAIDGVTSVAEAIEKYGELMPDIKPIHAFLTPCTKEEFEALITR
jgi:hypothetical protein